MLPSNLDIIKEYFDNYSKFVESCYESGISMIEMYFRLLNKNREMFDKSNDHQVEIFNAFMSGYEKAKMDLLNNNGFSHEKIKDPSDIYF